MLDVLLIHPGGHKGIYQSLTNVFTAIEPPLWTRLIASYLRGKDMSVDVWDTVATDSDPESIARAVSGKNATIVCVVVFGHQPSASTEMMTSAAHICSAIKEHNPGQIVTICGGHVSALPELTLKEVAVDYTIVGEGCKTLEQLVNSDGVSGPDIPGLVWYEPNKNEIVRNPSPSLVEDLDKEFNWNVWNLLPMDQYRAHNWQCLGDLERRQPYASIYTSLGCPYKCVFCCINAPFESNRYRMRSPLAVLTEISHLYHTYGVKTFKIIDEMFVLNRHHVKTICEGLKRLPFVDELNIWAYARIDTVTQDMLHYMKGSGIKWLALGIESGSALVRDGARKSFGQEDIFHIVKAIQHADINVMGNFIFGLPEDDLTSMEETYNLAEDLNCEFINFYSTMAYPGSPLHGMTDKPDLPLTWRGYSQHSYDCTPLPTKYLTATQVLKFRDESFQTYFQNPDYLEMVERKFGQAAVTHIKTMVKNPLPRKLLEIAA